MNSKQKGKRGELELVEFLKMYRLKARRAQQYKGTADSEDLEHSIDGVYIDCKYTDRTYPYDWLEKAVEDGGVTNVPLIAHRRARKKEWVAFMYLGDVIALLIRAGMAKQEMPASRPHEYAMATSGAPSKCKWCGHVWGTQDYACTHGATTRHIERRCGRT